MQNEQLKTILYEYANTKGVGLPLTAEECLNAMSTWLVGTLPECIDVVTETLEAGSEATVTLTGNGTPDNHYVFTFGIPQGATGATGAQGEKGDTGENATIDIGTVTTNTLEAGEEASVEIENVGNSINARWNYTFNVPKGDTGATGATGATGTEGLSTYDLAGPVTTSGTTATIDMFTVPSGYTVKVGDLVIGTDALLGQVYSISGSTYTIRYITSLLEQAEDYVTLDTAQEITAAKNFNQNTSTIGAVMLNDNSPRLLFSVSVSSYLTYIIKFSIRQASSPSYIVIKTNDLSSTNPYYCYVSCQGASLSFYSVLEDNVVYIIVNSIGDRGTGNIEYSFRTSDPKGVLTYHDTDYDGDISSLTDINVEYNLFSIGEGLTATYNNGRVILSSSNTIPTLYTYQVTLYFGLNSDETDTIIANFQWTSGEEIADLQNEISIISLLALLETENDAPQIYRMLQGNIPVTGTYYSTISALSYMITGAHINSNGQFALEYVLNDAQGLYSEITLEDSNIIAIFSSGKITYTNLNDGTSATNDITSA